MLEEGAVDSWQSMMGEVAVDFWGNSNTGVSVFYFFKVYGRGHVTHLERTLFFL